MAQFDVKRHAHQVCSNRLHYVFSSKKRLEIYHSNDKPEFDCVGIFSTKEISGISITETQREALKKRLYDILKGPL